MTEATEQDVEAGKKTYRARCLDHGIEWRTLEPNMCPKCQDEYRPGAIPTVRSEAVTPHKGTAVSDIRADMPTVNLTPQSNPEPTLVAPVEVRRPGRPPKARTE